MAKGPCAGGTRPTGPGRCERLTSALFVERVYARRGAALARMYIYVPRTTPRLTRPTDRRTLYSLPFVGAETASRACLVAKSASGERAIKACHLRNANSGDGDGGGDDDLALINTCGVPIALRYRLRPPRVAEKMPPLEPAADFCRLR